jgi:hypothetical protein
LRAIVGSIGAGGAFVFDVCECAGPIAAIMQQYLGPLEIDIFMNKDKSTMYEGKRTLLEYVKFGVGLTIESNQEFGWMNFRDNHIYENIIINKDGTITAIKF